MTNPLVKDIVAYRYGDQDILQRVAEVLHDGAMAFKVDLISADIGIGDVNLLNVSGVKINPATEDTLTIVNDKLPVLGQHVMSGSVSVVIASDQGAVPVSGIFWQATQPISAASLPLPAGAATEITVGGIKIQTDKLTFASTRLLIDGSGVTQPVSGPLTDAQLRASAIPISAASLPLPAGAATEVTLATRLAGGTFTDRVGEVQASPTANTVLARLKDIVTQMTMQVRGLYDSAGNAVESFLLYGVRRLEVVSVNGITRFTAEGKVFGVVAVDVNLPTANVDNNILLIDNPAGSGKTVLLHMGIFNETSSTSAAIYFKTFSNPTVTANGTAVGIVNRLLGSAIASVVSAYIRPTTSALGAQLEAMRVGAGSDPVPCNYNLAVQIPPGNKILFTGRASLLNKTVTLVLCWVEA